MCWGNRELEEGRRLIFEDGGTRGRNFKDVRNKGTTPRRLTCQKMGITFKIGVLQGVELLCVLGERRGGGWGGKALKYL